MSKTKALHDFVPDQIWHSYLKSKYMIVEKEVLNNASNRQHVIEFAVEDLFTNLN